MGVSDALALLAFSVVVLKTKHNLRQMSTKILKTFLALFSNKMLVIRAGIHIMRQKSKQKQSDLGLHCLSRPF